MALFEKHAEGEEVPVTRGDKLNTVIGKDSVFNGTLEVAGTLRIDGTIKGEVTVSDTISVGTTGTVEATVKTKNAVISGTIRGNIHATEKIELQAKSVIYGDIVTKALAIEQGSVFQGHCNMGSKESTQSSLPISSAPKAEVVTADKKK